MKKNIIFIMLFITLTLLLTSCSKEFNGTGNKNNSPESTLSNLKIEIAQKDEELEKTDTLIDKLLSTVYYGYAEPVGEGDKKNFTAFGMFYKDDFYLITAGHCIEYNGIEYTNFKFKLNGSQTFLYPKLLDYSNDYKNNNDYAIFYHHFVRKGLLVYDKDKEDKEPKYVLGNTEGNINLFRKFNAAAEGESGSPILNSKCKLVGIVIKNNDQYTPIEAITEAIDKLVN